MRSSKWLALLLALCMLLSMFPAAMSEELEINVDGEIGVEGDGRDADGLELDADLTLDTFDLPADGRSRQTPQPPAESRRSAKGRSPTARTTPT